MSLDIPAILKFCIFIMKIIYVFFPHETDTFLKINVKFKIKKQKKKKKKVKNLIKYAI